MAALPLAGSQDNGGAVFSASALNVSASSFTSGFAALNGGALYSSTNVYSDTNTFTSVYAAVSGGAAAAQGLLWVTGATVTNASAAKSGGALWAGQSVVLSSSAMQQTTAVEGGATGGAVHSAASLSVTGCTFQQSRAGSAGGAVFSLAGPLSVTQSTFTACTTASGGSGGALAARGGATAISAATFSSCAADLSGGAVALTGASSATIDSSSFTATSCTAGTCTGGAVSVVGQSAAAQVTVTATSFASTSSNGDGGALLVSSAALNVSLGCSFTGSSSAAGRGGALFASGAAVVSAAAFQSCFALSSGGAAFFLSAAPGAVSVDSSTFSGCSTSAQSGGAIAGSTAAAANVSSAPVVTVTNSAFTSNSAVAGYGGAISAPSLASAFNTFSGNMAASGGAVALPNGGLLADTNSSFASNTATTGGCVFVWGTGAAPPPPLSAAAFLNGTAFSQCRAVTPSAHGGAIAAFAANVSFTSCSFDSCAADTSAGSTGALQCLARLSADTLGRGGAVFANHSVVSVNGSTFSRCYAGDGGALFLGGSTSTLAVTASQFTANSARGDQNSPTPGTSGVLGAASFRGIAGELGHGGAIDSDDILAAAIDSSAFSRNTAVGNGGACDLDVASTLALTDTAFSDNSAGVLGGALSTTAALSADANCTFARNAAQLAGGAVFLQMPSIARAGSRPPLPACLAAGGACVGAGNTANLYGPVFATNLTDVAVNVTNATRTGTDLAAQVTLVDGFGQEAAWWPETVVSVSCNPCPTLTGILRVSYDSSRQLVNTILSANQLTEWNLAYQATSPWLPNWSPTTTVHIKVLACRFLELYEPATGTCECVDFAVRNADGSCKCPGATGATADLTSCQVRSVKNISFKAKSAASTLD